MGFQGIDIRESGDRLLFTASLKDIAGLRLTSGTAYLYLYEWQNDGSLKSYDFNDHTFKATALTTNRVAMTHRLGNNGTQNTGVWSYMLTTVTWFTANNRYMAVVEHATAIPDFQEREFQYGGGVLADVRRVNNLVPTVSNLITVFETYFSAAWDATNHRWNIAGPTAGASIVTLTVNDGASPIQGALVHVHKGGLDFYATTNVSGIAIFGLDYGTWDVSITAPGYAYTPSTIVVDAPTEAATLSMSSSPISPSAPGLTTGYLTTYSNLGVVESNVNVYCVARNTGETSGIAVDSEARLGTSNGSGLVQFANLFKGLTYSFYRAGSPEKAINVDIPTDAGATYELPSLIGKD